MRLNCNINGSQYSLVVNSDKPLSHILREQIITFAENSQCQGASCGNCIVLINGNAALSCLVPAFKLNGASILTFEGFQKTRFCHDIERAYADIGNQPCPQCYPSKTIIIESILNKIDKENQNRIGGFQMTQGPHNDLAGNQQNASVSANEQAARSRMGTSGITTEMIAKELAMSSCQCIEVSDLEKIINLAYKYRSRRRARRS
ncbi:MAG: ferredoxin [Spirochaetales bacterium]|jgi:aerobic-type carbon monoxide dehydrogenase small subunit (CoxS/CutS family)|nr:ferredoxin [Spirochaetales bacterium]